MTPAQSIEQSVNPTILIILVLCLVFFGVTYMVGKNLSAYNTTKRRVRELKSKRDELRDAYAGTKKHAKVARKTDEEKVESLQSMFKKLNIAHEKTAKEMRDLLIAAGYRSKSAPLKFVMFQTIAAIGFMFISLMFVKIDLNNLGGSLMNMFIPFGAVCAGYFLPKIMVVNARTKRYLEIQKALPDALDLMMICTEAGLTLSAALDRVSKEMSLASPIMAEELALTSVEIGFLPERRKALENLATRVNLPEIRSLVGILIQTEKYGTPISHALRVLSREFRTQRMLRAEQKAARLPAIMTVPMIIFILPTLFIVVISPAIINVMAQ